MLFQFDTTRSDGQFRKPASNAKLRKLIGEFEFTPFDKGKFTFGRAGFQLLTSRFTLPALQDTVQWFLKNYNNARIGNVSKA